VNFERRKLRRVLEWRFMPIVSVAQQEMVGTFHGLLRLNMALGANEFHNVIVMAIRKGNQDDIITCHVPVAYGTCWPCRRLQRVSICHSKYLTFDLSAKISQWSDKIKAWIRPNVLMVNCPLRLADCHDVML
jgi:hypothetical protein